MNVNCKMKIVGLLLRGRDGKIYKMKQNEKGFMELVNQTIEFIIDRNVKNHFVVQNPPANLKCRICEKLMIDPVRIDCCGKIACDSCMRNKIIEE